MKYYIAHCPGSGVKNPLTNVKGELVIFQSLEDATAVIYLLQAGYWVAYPVE